MGLVTTAVVSSFAIEKFEPKLICMSGICGGVPCESSIYDVLITDVCHQHDVGKWSNDGFRSEHYDVQVNPNVRNRLEELKNSPEVIEFIGNNINLQRPEFPEGMDKYEVALNLVATSSGSAVMADEGRTASLSGGQ